MRFSILVFIGFTLTSNAQFDPPGGETGSISIRKDDPSISAWATDATITKGYMQISDSTLGKPTIGSDSSAIGEMDGNVVSLGDGGNAVLTFGNPVINRVGYDFAVFENGFKVGLSYYLELAHVEVSKDGVNYTRFPSESLTDTSYQTNNFSYTKPEEIRNLAGKHQAPYGSLFDLSEVNMDTINYIRLIDVVGSVNDSFGSRDSKGRIINDPYPSPFESSGFDLDAVALVDGAFLLKEEHQLKGIRIYPTKLGIGEELQFVGIEKQFISIYNSLGQKLYINPHDSITFSQSGFYTLIVEKNGKSFIQKICVY
ncbi:MAG: T9SS C-terminal target domain-containing protein [Bacteroidia bacterium]|nr:T9SS C-terminal target domain-containing protein [Bacteroidia bacterium]